jgi:hypothetical protein
MKRKHKNIWPFLYGAALAVFTLYVLLEAL